MEPILVRKNPNVGYPCTPSRWVGEPQYRKITRIKMSCGGGMGGSRWYEYVDRITDIPADSIITVKRIDGKTITINTRWLVMAEDFTLCRMYYDTQNYHVKEGMHLLEFLLEDRQKITLTTDFDGNYKDCYYD